MQQPRNRKLKDMMIIPRKTESAHRPDLTKRQWTYITLRCSSDSAEEAASGCHKSASGSSSAVLLLPLGTMMTPRGVPCSFVLNQDAGRKSDGTSFQTSNTSKTNKHSSLLREGRKERTPGVTRQRQKPERKAKLTGSLPKPFQSNNKSLLQRRLSKEKS